MLHLMLVAAVLGLQDAPPSQTVESQPIDEEPVIELLRAVDQATRETRIVRYDSEYCGTGALAARIAVVQGAVLVEANDEGISRIACEGVMYEPPRDPESQEGATAVFDLAFDGERMILLNHDKKVVMRGRSGAGFAQPANRLHMIELSHPRPFSDEINASVVELEGRTLVEGVLCDVVYINYGPESNNQKARWYFGAEDHLPRRVERLRQANNREGAIVTTISNLETDVGLSDDMFTLDVPEDYTARRAPRRLAPAARRGNRPGL